jgi:hypothetical protein
MIPVSMGSLIKVKYDWLMWKFNSSKSHNMTPMLISMVTD